MQHSVLPPSSAFRRVACPGSRALEQQYPELEPSPHALEGDAAHWVAQQMLIRPCNKERIKEGDLAPNGELITQEMIEGALIYESDIYTYGPDDLTDLHVEERIEMPSIHSQCWGTPDAWAFKTNTLWVWDYKFGRSYVDAFENWQLIAYVSGILDKLEINGLADSLVQVQMRIVQPRCYHLTGFSREWTLQAAELRPYFNILSQAEHASMLPNAVTKVGQHCKHCNARRACTTLRDAAQDAVTLSINSTPLDLSPDELGVELRMLQQAAQLLDARITGLSEQAISLLKSGKQVSHFRLEQGQGREEWNKPYEEIVALGDIYKIKIDKPALITPNQAIKAGLPADLVKTYSQRKPGSLKLVECTEKELRKIFNKPIDSTVNNG